jgi:ankyrin repeat protein
MSKTLCRFSSGVRAILLAALVFSLVPPALADGKSEALAAAYRGNTGTLVKLLESKGTSANAVDENGNSLLILATREGHTETVTALLRFRPDLDRRNNRGDSALMFAAMRGDEKLVDLLLKHGARTDPNGKGWTALHYAAFEGKLAVVERLLGAGANVEALTPNLSDALMLAARNGHIEVVRRLLKTPITLGRRNDHGITAEEWARSKGNTDIAGLIEKARAERKH